MNPRSRPSSKNMFRKKRALDFGLLSGLLFVLFLTADALGALGTARPSQNEFIYDYARVLDNKSSLEMHLKTLRESADMEMVVVTLPGLEGEGIDELATRIMGDWRIGKETGGLRGILFLLAVKERLVRFEVGYDLEPIYPDAFVGYIEQDQMAPFFELGRITDGISATLEMIIARAYEKIEDVSYRPDGEKGNRGATHFSGGAGANRRIAVGSIKIPDIIPYSGEIQTYFSPQPTPALAFLRDIEKNRRHIRGYDFDLYTDETRRISREWAFTKAQMDNQVRNTQGKSFTISIKKDRAVAIFPIKHRSNAPFFFQQCDRGWQVDIASMSRMIHFDMRNRFHMHFEGNPYLDLFKRDYAFDVYGYLYERDQAPPCMGVRTWEDGSRSATIGSLVRGGPAERSGLRPGDTIVQIGKTRIEGVRDLGKALHGHRVGDVVRVAYRRGVFKKSTDISLDVFDPYGL